MHPADRPVFLQGLLVLSELFGKPLSAAVQMIFVETLHDLDLEALQHAMRTCAQTCRFMPMPADIRRLVVGDTPDAAEVAWQTYKETARTVGGYASPTFQDGAIGATVLAVFDTWEQACGADLSPEVWIAKRREFGRVYPIMRERQRGPLTLAGFCERTNHARGYDVEAPRSARLLGDGTPAVRRRINGASDETREQWRQNVANAIAARDAGTIDAPVTSDTTTAAMTPLAQIAAETTASRNALHRRVARFENMARTVVHEMPEPIVGDDGIVK